MFSGFRHSARNAARIAAIAIPVMMSGVYMSEVSAPKPDKYDSIRRKIEEAIDAEAASKTTGKQES